jgi:hypothetical protein
MIYFLTARELGRVKIGYAKDPYQRINQLKTGCPAKCTIEAVIEGDQAFEAELHQMFRKFRTHGEWFELSPALEMAIRICHGATPLQAIRAEFADWYAAREVCPL